MARAESQGTTMAAPEAGALVASAAAATTASTADTGVLSSSEHAAGLPRTLPSSAEAAAGGGAVQLSAAVAASGAHVSTGTAGNTPAASAPPSPSPMASPAPAHHGSWGCGQGVVPGMSRAGSERLHPGSRHGTRPSSHPHPEPPLLPSLLRCSTAVPSLLPSLQAHALTAGAGAGGKVKGTRRGAQEALLGPEFAAAASVLRRELLSLFDALPAEAFRANNFWGSKERQTHPPLAPWSGRQGARSLMLLWLYRAHHARSPDIVLV
eukprot:57196-Pelagomonas_calceolata.AAC.1